MNKKAKHFVLILVTVTLLFAASQPAWSGQLARPLYQNGAPTVVSYQGQVTVNGVFYTGDGYFKFAVVNQAGDTSYWSNDGTSNGGGEPNDPVTLAVSKGLFNVLFGDTSLDHMTALPASVFSETGRYLRVWFSSDDLSFEQLSPDQRIASAPYALQAEEAKNAAALDGLGANDFWQLAGNAATNPAVDFLGTTDNQPLVLRTNNTEQARLDTTGNLGLGTTSPSERLTLDGNALILGNDSLTARGYTSTNLDSPRGFFVAGHYAYLTSSNNNRLAIFDVSDPDNIIAKGYTTTNLSSPAGIYVAGRYAYVTSGNNDRLAIFDVSDPNNIVAKGYTSTNLDIPIAVYVAGRYAYVASSWNNNLAIFDISDPNNIIPKGYTSTNLNGPESVYVAGRYAYIANVYNNCLAIFDVSDPGNIVAKGYTSTNLSFPRSVVVVGRYAYVASYSNSRLAIFDVSNPNTIVAKGYTTTNLENPFKVTVAGPYAYVTSYTNSRLAVFDISDPNNIVAKGYTSTNLGSPFGVVVVGRFAYVTNLVNDNLSIFELNSLASPTLETGSLLGGSLQVNSNAIINNDLMVQGSLNVGPGGALVGGNLGVEGEVRATGGIITNLTTVTASTTLVVKQAGVVLANNTTTATITLPAAASSKGLTFTIKRLNTGAVTVNTAGGNIDGAASQSLAAQYDWITVISDGTNWYIIGR
jgi:hypothetical protein